MTTILDCGHARLSHSEFTTGYGLDQDGNKICYDCCAKTDREYMKEHGKITLYLCDGEVTNWPGSLRLKIGPISESWHNMGGIRRDFWFAFNNRTWHGYSIGDFTQIAHCSQNKA